MKKQYPKHVTSLCETETTNFLDDKLSNSFFLSRQYYFYYNSTKRVGEKRDISEELISNLHAFFRFAANKDSIHSIDHLIEHIAKSQYDILYSNINNQVKMVNPDGYDLLCIKSELTVEYLKTCYRNACKKYHPDVGGSNELMKIINNAYQTFHKLILEFIYVSNNDDNSSWYNFVFENSVDYFYMIGMFLVTVCTDIMAVDKAYEILKEIEIFGLDNNSKTRRAIFLYKEGDLRKLAQRLSIAGLRAEAEYVFKLFEAICLIENSMSVINIVKEEINKPTMRAVLLRHPIQISNSYRLGIIDETKHNKLMKPFHTFEEYRKSSENKLKDYACKYGFMEDLEIIPTDKLLQKPDRLVPEPGYGELRFENLKENQKVEYLNCFSKDIKFDLIRKYLWQRINSFFVVMIKSFNNVNHSDIIRECRFIESVFEKDKVPFHLVYELYNYLKSLSKLEREKRLEILNKFDSPKKEEMVLTFSFQRKSFQRQCKFQKTIEISNEYFDFAKLPLKTLEYIGTSGDYNPYGYPKKPS